MEWLARAGLLARVGIYAVIAVLSIKLAVGDGGKATDQQGALKSIAGGGVGTFLLIVLAIGLFGYAAWNLARAAVGHGVEVTDDTKDRISNLASGISYMVIFASAVQILLGSGGGGGGNPEDKATGGVLGWPGGQFLVGIAGLILIGVGLDQARRGITKSFCDDTRVHEMKQKTRKVYEAIGVFGHLARAVVFALIGIFTLKAAIEFDPKDAVGLDGALAELAKADYGPVLLGVVAFGLLGFALYSVMDARYRRV